MWQGVAPRDCDYGLDQVHAPQPQVKKKSPGCFEGVLWCVAAQHSCVVHEQLDI